VARSRGEELARLAREDRQAMLEREGMRAEAAIPARR
jgi:hypothetical protein